MHLQTQMTTPDPQLFPPTTGAALSPRLAWLRKHGLEIFCQDQEVVGIICPENGETVKAWLCGRTEQTFCQDTMNERWIEVNAGDTADEACANYAKAHGLRLWNEVTP